MIYYEFIRIRMMPSIHAKHEPKHLIATHAARGDSSNRATIAGLFPHQTSQNSTHATSIK
jgi:hypothetical protein